MLKMTDEQKYSAVLKELGDVLTSKNTTISCQSWQIDQLKEKLDAAEKERAIAQKERCSLRLILAAFNSTILDCVDMQSGTIRDVDTLLSLQDDLKAVLLGNREEGGAA